MDDPYGLNNVRAATDELQRYISAWHAATTPRQEAPRSSSSEQTSSSEDLLFEEHLRKWLGTDWQAGEALLAELKKAGAANSKLIRELFVRMQLIEAGLIDTRRMVLEQQNETSDSAHSASSSSAYGDEEGSILLKGVSGDQLFKLQQGDWRWLVAGQSVSLDPPKIIRSWPSHDGMMNVLLVVKPSQRRQFTMLGKQAGVTWAPYLSSSDLELRKQRTEIFRSLKEQGCEPRWHGAAGIRHLKDGKLVDYSF